MHYPCTRVGSIVCTNDGMMNQILTWLTVFCHRAITIGDISEIPSKFKRIFCYVNSSLTKGESQITTSCIKQE